MFITDPVEKQAKYQTPTEINKQFNCKTCRREPYNIFAELNGC
jgi:hypothetical protein